MMHRKSDYWRPAGILSLAVMGLTLTAVNADEPPWAGHESKLEVTSTTFTKNGPLPDSVIYNDVYQGANLCTADGATGGDESPEVQWAHVPPHTQSFVVVMYDTTAAFTHWAMYNIAPNLRSLPQNAGVAGSSYGSEVLNDFYDPNYDGPCPPSGVAPDAHHYVITVYALDTKLNVRTLPNFPANAETLYHALIHAARDGHILASGSLGTYYSDTPPMN